MNQMKGKKKVTWKENEYVPIVAHKSKCYREEEDEDVSGKDVSIFGRCFDCVMNVPVGIEKHSLIVRKIK